MRRILVTLAAVLLTLALGAPAIAGGWAATTLDEVPPDMRAGETYQIGYTIRQHGVTPRNVEDMGGTTEIRITSPDGAKTLSYAGVREGATGHYIAKITFPYEGAWTWSVTQGPFQPQALGTVKVLPAAGAAAQPAQPAAAGASARQPASTNPFLAIVLLLAVAGAAVLFGTRVAAFAGRRASA